MNIKITSRQIRIVLVSIGYFTIISTNNLRLFSMEFLLTILGVACVSFGVMID